MFESLIRRYLEQSQNSDKPEQVTFDPANLQTSALSAVNNMRETFGFQDRDSLIRLFEELGETRISAQHYARAIDDNKLIKIEKKKPVLANALKLLAQYVGLSPIIGIDTASFAIPLIQLEHIPRSEAIRLHDSGGKTAPDLCHAYLSMGYTGLEAVKYMRQVVIGPLTVTTAKGELAVSGWMKAQQYVTQQLTAELTPFLPEKTKEPVEEPITNIENAKRRKGTGNNCALIECSSLPEAELNRLLSCGLQTDNNLFDMIKPLSKDDDQAKRCFKDILAGKIFLVGSQEYNTAGEMMDRGIKLRETLDVTTPVIVNDEPLNLRAMSVGAQYCVAATHETQKNEKQPKSPNYSYASAGSIFDSNYLNEKNRVEYQRFLDYLKQAEQISDEDENLITDAIRQAQSGLIDLFIDTDAGLEALSKEYGEIAARRASGWRVFPRGTKGQVYFTGSPDQSDKKKRNFKAIREKCADISKKCEILRTQKPKLNGSASALREELTDDLNTIYLKAKHLIKHGETIVANATDASKYDDFADRLNKIKRVIETNEQKLVSASLHEIIYTIHAFYPYMSGNMDAISDGCLGLHKAIDVYDYTRGRFSRYAKSRIRSGIHSGSLKRRASFARSDRLHSINNKALCESYAYYAQTGEETNDEILAERLGTTPKAIATARCVSNLLRLDAPFNDETEETFGEHCLTTSEADLESQLDTNKLSRSIERYLAALDVDEEEIIRAVYGINRDIMSQTDIAESLGEDTKNIYGLKERALNKLHNFMLSDRSMFQHWIDLEEKLAKDPPNYLASRSLSRLEI